MTWTIHQGDSLDVLRTMPDGSVNCVVTSPPYWGLRDYGTATWDGGSADCDHKGEPMRTRAHVNANCGTGIDGKNAANHQPMRNVCAKCGARRIDKQIGLERTPEEYVARMVEVFREVRRVLAADGTCWVNIGDSYATGAGKVGDGPGGGEQGAKWAGSAGTRTVWRDSQISHEGENRTRGLRDGTHAGKNTAMAALGPMTQPNRMPLPGLKPKDLVGIPWRLAFALQSDGWWLRQDIIWSKPNPMPESVRDRCTKAHEYVFLLTKSERYYWLYDAMREPATDTGRVNGRDGRDDRLDYSKMGPTPEAHFATFPIDLPDLCISAGCPDGGTVLDPFSGAGTTGLACIKNGRRYVGIELNQEYVKISYARARKYFSLLVAESLPTHCPLEAAVSPKSPLSSGGINHLESGEPGGTRTDLQR